MKDSAAPSPGAVPNGARPIWRAVLAEPVAIGLAIFALLRPWRDGLTFPPFNIYFIAFILLIAALWGARMLLRNEAIRYPVPAALFAGFLIVVYLTGFSTIEYNLTHRTFQYLIAYFLLFLLCSNALRTPLSVGLVLGAFVLSSLLNAAWSIVHYYETLPALRALLNASPEVLLRYFGTLELTPELKNRLETNRAFGTFLFPNHLGAFLILVIPYLISQLRPSWRALGEGLRRSYGLREAGETPAERSVRAYVALGSAGSVWLVSFVVPLLLNERLGAMNMDGARPVESVGVQILLFGVVPAVLGGGTAFLVWRHGLAALGATLRFVCVFLALPVTLYALWLSYSRGATVALGAAGLLALALYRFGGRMGPLPGVVSKAAVALLLVVLLMPGLDGTDALAQEITDPGLKPSGLHLGEPFTPVLADANSKSLSVEGVGRGLGELTSLASFKMRVTYWQVGLLMFQDNFWTGVGLGNFKVAYPLYQFLGAGDVEMAHNGYLQTFCETGVLGGALFSAFWIYFVVWGGRRILHEADSSRRAVLAGHYAGVVAFALHALVDFDFANPSLAPFAYLLAGTFYAHARALAPADAQSKGRQTQAGRIIAVPLLLLVAVSTGSAVRMFFFDYGLTEGTGGQRLLNIGDRRSFDTRTDAANFFIKDLKAGIPDPSKPPWTSLRQAYALIPDEPLLESFGSVWVPVEGGGARRLRPGEPVPETALLAISDPTEAARARQAGIEAAERRIDVLKEWDTLYPHDPDIAARVFLWYDLLF
ncbi:MAG: O-antigen ligase family protein, partial [Candidatus Hydrogenedentes bacterium]|nr:O-antigen ligase family protein [Candidatus Hydrogenedentota bacterium]